MIALTGGLTIQCIHCGIVRVDDPATAYRVRDILGAVADGHAPLAGITCPLCRDEVNPRLVILDEEGR